MAEMIIENLWKKFYLGTSKKQGIIQDFIHLLSGRETKETFWALKGISFTAKGGDLIGIIGKNGSGKSTLLRTIAGIYSKDKGNIRANPGLISPLSINEGLKLRLTMKENIFLCCSILGLTNKEIKSRFDEIVRFAELEKYEDTKLYQFSNGMIIRLGSAIGFYSLTGDKKILLIDDESDILDKDFKEKCDLKIKEIMKKDSIILFASHQLENLKKRCNRIIWIEDGKIIKDGGKEVIEKYISKTNKKKINV